MNHDGKEVSPLYISKTRDFNPITLLLIQGENKNDYTWIKSFDRLLSYDVNNSKRFCFYCMYGFDKRYNADEKLMEHMPVCFENGAKKEELSSKEEKIIQFRDIEKQMELPFVIYADFEPIFPKSEDDSATNTRKINKHEACIFTFTTISPFYEPNTVSYRGSDAGEKSCKKF